MVSTADDLARCSTALLSGGLLRPAVLQEMTTPTQQSRQDGEPYGLGVRVYDSECGQVWGQTGSYLGYLSLTYADRHGRGVQYLIPTGPLTTEAAGAAGTRLKAALLAHSGNGIPPRHHDVIQRAPRHVIGGALPCQVVKAASRPVLFLDVDGPLIPFGGQHETVEHPPARRLTPALAGALAANPLLRRVDPRCGRWLATLPCELIWATTWMAEANEVIGPLLGLPELPVVDWPEDADDEQAGPCHWKTRGLVDWAGGRCFVWLDDEITNADRRWVAAHHPAPALLHRVDPRRGLTHDDIQVIDNWLTQQRTNEH